MSVIWLFQKHPCLKNRQVNCWMTQQFKLSTRAMTCNKYGSEEMSLAYLFCGAVFIAKADNADVPLLNFRSFLCRPQWLSEHSQSIQIQSASSIDVLRSRGRWGLWLLPQKKISSAISVSWGLIPNDIFLGSLSSYILNLGTIPCTNWI